jgi:hypothetical protein
MSVRGSKVPVNALTVNVDFLVSGYATNQELATHLAGKLPGHTR